MNISKRFVQPVVQPAAKCERSLNGRRVRTRARVRYYHTELATFCTGNKPLEGQTPRQVSVSK